MARYPTNPAHRERRMAMYVVLLSLLLTALLLVLDFPLLIVQGALTTIQERYAFGPREIIARFGPQQGDMPPLWYYIVHNGDWFARCSVERDGLFQRPSALTAAHLDGEAPLAILVSPAFDGRSQELAVVPGGPDVAAMEVDYLSGFDLPPHLRTVRREAPEDQCFLFTLENPYHGLPLHTSPSACFRVRCYNADGKLLCKSPYSARWLEHPIFDSYLKVVTP